MLLDVYVAGVDWNRGNEFDVDMALVEDLRPSPVAMSSSLGGAVHQRVGSRRRASDCMRAASRNRKREAFRHWAAALTTELPEGCEQLTHSLRGRDIDGRHHLFGNLKTRNCPMTPSRLGVLESGLVNRGARMATSAGTLVRGYRILDRTLGSR